MKRKHRIIVWIVIILVLFAGITGLFLYRKGKDTKPGSSPAKETTQPAMGEEPKILVMAVDAPFDTAYGKLALAYKEEVETMSGGMLTINIYENGILGTGTELLTTIGNDANAADIMLVLISDLAEVGCTDSAKLLEPYRFNGHDGFLKWAKSKEAAALLEEPERSGLGATGLFFTEDGFRYLFLKEDHGEVKGKQIAAKASEWGEKYVSQTGGVYQYLPSVDIKEAILSGDLDGVEQDLRFYKENSLWEAAPYIIVDYHLFSPCSVLITLEAAEKLSKEERDILKTAGKKAAEASIESIKQEEEAMLKAFSGYGAKTVKLKK